MLLMLSLVGCADPSQVEVHWATKDKYFGNVPYAPFNLWFSQPEAEGCPVEGSPEPSIEGMGEGTRKSGASGGRLRCTGLAWWQWPSVKDEGPYEIVLPNAGEVHLDFGPGSSQVLNPPENGSLTLGSELQVDLPYASEWGNVSVRQLDLGYGMVFPRCSESWTLEGNLLTLQIREDVPEETWPTGCADTVVVSLPDDALAHAITRCDFNTCRITGSSMKFNLEYKLAER